MVFYVLEPEVAGSLGERTVMDSSVHPPQVSRLHYEIDYGWLGDELLESFPCYIITEGLGQRLVESGLGLFELREVEPTLSPEALDERTTADVPTFRWLRITGIAGRDDLGLTEKGQLVVSERSLDVLRSGTLNNCDIEPYGA